MYVKFDTSGKAEIKDGRSITSAEYKILLARLVRSIAGQSPPTPAHVALAKKLMTFELAHKDISVVGSFWSRFTNAAKTAAPVALPMMMPGAAAAPLLMKAAAAKKKSDAARVKASAPSEDSESPAAQEVMGDRYVESQEHDDEPSTDTIFFGGCVSGEERELAMMGGSAERAALRRRLGGSSSLGAAMPDRLYRAAIWQRASKLSRGKNPDARAMFVAKKSVDRALAQRGIGIEIPGGRPARKTV